MEASYIRKERMLMELARHFDGLTPQEWITLGMAKAYREEWEATDGHPTLAGVYRRAGYK